MRGRGSTAQRVGARRVVAAMLLGAASVLAFTAPAADAPRAAAAARRGVWPSCPGGRGAGARAARARRVRGAAAWAPAMAAVQGGMPRGDAERVLAAFDAEQQRVAREGFGGVREGFGGGTSAAKWAAAHPDWPALRSAVRTLAGESEKVMMGICAEDAFEGVAALKEWVGALQLARCGRAGGHTRTGVHAPGRARCPDVRAQLIAAPARAPGAACTAWTRTGSLST